MAICSHCSNPITEGNKYCSVCGQAVAGQIILCAQCGTRNAIQAKFCEACGSSLEDTTFSITEIPSDFEEYSTLEDSEIQSEIQEVVSKHISEKEDDASEEVELNMQRASRMSRARLLIENLVNKNTSKQADAKVSPQEAELTPLKSQSISTEFTEPNGDSTSSDIIPIVYNPIAAKSLNYEDLYNINEDIQKSLVDELTSIANDLNDPVFLGFARDRLLVRDIAGASPFHIPEQI